MPCFGCISFKEGRLQNGKRSDEISRAGEGWCELHRRYYWRGHECPDFAPVWRGRHDKDRSSLDEPGGCFLTTACVEYFDLPDDCKELTTLRTFRDTVLKATPDGAALVEEYYRIAPPLVEKLDVLPNREEIYKNVYDRILVCIQAIEATENETAVRLYKEMVEYVKGEV